MIEIVGVHHVAIIVSDYLRAKRFYLEILGGTVVSEIYREDRQSHKLNFQLPGGLEVELFDFIDAPARLTQPEARGLRHLALSVTDIEAAIEHLLANGVDAEPVRIDPLTGNRFIFFRDPDGLPIELVEVS